MDVLWNVFSPLLSNAISSVLWHATLACRKMLLRWLDDLLTFISTHHSCAWVFYSSIPCYRFTLSAVWNNEIILSELDFIKQWGSFALTTCNHLFISKKILIIKPNQSRSYKAKIKPTTGITRWFPEYKWSCKIHCCTKATFIQIHQVFILITFIALLPPFTFKCKSYFVILLKILYRTKENYYTNAIT